MPVLKAPGASETAPPLSDDADLIARATEFTLPSGRVILWLAPDEMELLAFTGTLPEGVTASVYQHLLDEGAIKDADDPLSYHRELNKLKAEYQVLEKGMVKPRFDASLSVGTADGAILGRRDVPRGDREYAWGWLFRIGVASPAFQTAQTDKPGRAADVTPDSESVRGESGGADQARD